jgi:hypothetical protein
MCRLRCKSGAGQVPTRGQSGADVDRCCAHPDPAAQVRRMSGAGQVLARCWSGADRSVPAQQVQVRCWSGAGQVQTRVRLSRRGSRADPVQTQQGHLRCWSVGVDLVQAQVHVSDMQGAGQVEIRCSLSRSAGQVLARCRPRCIPGADQVLVRCRYGAGHVLAGRCRLRCMPGAVLAGAGHMQIRRRLSRSN